MSLRPWLLSLLLLAGQAAAIDPLPFTDAAEEARFRALTAELRCVMCQNQSLADSNAGIANDLRREVLDLMQGGRSDVEIKAYLTERYGDFVLYRPPMRPDTWLLWFAPLLIVLGGGAFVVVILRRRAAMFVKEDPAKTPTNDVREDW